MLNLGAKAAQLWFVLRPIEHTTDINLCLVQLEFITNTAETLTVQNGLELQSDGCFVSQQKKALNSLVSCFCFLPTVPPGEKSDDHPFPYYGYFILQLHEGCPHERSQRPRTRQLGLPRYADPWDSGEREWAQGGFERPDVVVG